MNDTQSQEPFNQKEDSALRKTWKDLFNEGYEVSSRIFSCLDIESFLACRLVCHDWRPAVNRYKAKWQEIKAMPLLKAIKKGKVLVAHALISNGADLKVEDPANLEKWLSDDHNDWHSKSRTTPLHWAAAKGLASVAEHLIAEGADIEADEDYYGFTPMHWAARQNHLDMVKLLIAHNANLESMDIGRYQTPLSLASERGNDSIIKELIESILFGI